MKKAQLVGATVILSDGDAVFQPRKVERSGLWPVFGDNVLIYVHKELELADVENHFPARHYVMIDDKLRILDAIKRAWGDRVTTVFPRQGRYAMDPDHSGGISAGRHHGGTHRGPAGARSRGPGRAIKEPNHGLLAAWLQSDGLRIS